MDDASSNLARETRNTYMRGYLNKRYRVKIQEAKNHLGGQCVDCGTIEQLEFDHIDPAQKSFTITVGWSRADFWSEVAKCVLRCKPCHAVRTTQQQSVDHGQGLTGKRNCRCGLCGPLKNAYARRRRT